MTAGKDAFEERGIMSGSGKEQCFLVWNNSSRKRVYLVCWVYVCVCLKAHGYGAGSSWHTLSRDHSGARSQLVQGASHAGQQRSEGDRGPALYARAGQRVEEVAHRG